MTRSNKAGRGSPLLILAVWLLASCSIRTADLTLVSTKNIDLTDTRLDAKSGQRYTGKHCGLRLLGIPLGIPSLKEAIDQALESGKGNIMVDEVTWKKEYPFVVGRVDCLEVEGTVLTAPIVKIPSSTKK